MSEGRFLSELVLRAWSPRSKDFQEKGLFLGQGTNAIEVAVASSPSRPGRTELLETWKERHAKRATPVLVVVLHPEGASLCGASGEEPPIYTDSDVSRIERLCRETLAQPDRHAALRFLTQALPSLETDLPGINNEGLLAFHALRAWQNGGQASKCWAEANTKARNACDKRDADLLGELGFQIERIDNLTSLLRGGDRRMALAVMLRESESPEAGNDRFNSLSPVSYALKKADDEDLAWVILTQGNRLRLYATEVAAGVGRRGRTETYIECQPNLLADEHLPYLWLLYSAEALAPEGSLHQILKDSQRFAGDLAERLRERIYDHVVPLLAKGIVEAQNIEAPSPEDVECIYEMALTVLFRLLFTAYAEDRDLLPYRSNEAYRRRSLKQKAQELAEGLAKNTPVAEGDAHWHEVVRLWRAIATGNPEWDVPAYNGGLFSDDSDVSPSGAALASIALPNESFETALRYLLVIETSEGNPGPVDFRSLGVREFGTIYEGLLESELALAETDLILKGQKQKSEWVYVPAQESDTPDVVKGEVYLHNRSGVRKSSGSYYTKPFAVEHLLDGALEPALEDHFSRLDDLDDTDAAEAFFDFRVADIAMGSGHFLVAAIDRIEKRMADYLADRNLVGVNRELGLLRAAAVKELGASADAADIEDGRLLRRMIARRCIYGVDLNSLAVRLAQLAIWIHTFVPGLPLSFLDHNLVHGNALVGVGDLDEIKARFGKAAEESSLFEIDTESLLGAASKPLKRLANVNDATLADIAAARKAMQEAQHAIRDTENLCDIMTAQQISESEKVQGFRFEDWNNSKHDPETLELAEVARQDLSGLSPFHFPVAFPEVFLRKRPGFNVILGNPPWQEVTVEELAFWARHFPGLRGLTKAEQEAKVPRLRKERPDLVKLYETELGQMKRLRKILVNETFPGMGTGDPDLYKAFCWRFWDLSVAEGGHIGIVLPRSAFSAKGSEKFRKTIFKKSEQVDVTALKNRKGWVFDNVTPQYSVCLVCITRGQPISKSIRLCGPFTSREAFRIGINEKVPSFDHEEVLAWNDTVSLPLLPDLDSVSVFAQIRKAPRLDLDIGGGGGIAWRARPDREIDATMQKGLMTFRKSDSGGEPDPIPNSTPPGKRNS